MIRLIVPNWLIMIQWWVISETLVIPLKLSAFYMLLVIFKL